MKKFMYSVLAAATMLFATTSCSSEEEIVGGSQSGDTQQVTFTVQLPGEEATSRAIAYGEKSVTVGNGQMADKLIWALYESTKTGQDLVLTGEGTKVEGANAFTAKINMVKGLEYKVLFFAYNDGTIFDMDNHNGLRSLKYKTKDGKIAVSANQEAYDAFAACHTHTVNDEAVTEVKLYRPFAQINAATTEDDLNRARDLSAVVTQTELVIKNVPTEFDILTGKVNDESLKDVTYQAAPILKNKNAKEGEHPNEDISVEEKPYKYLTMAYVLAGNGETIESTHNTTFNFYRGENDDLVRTFEIPSLPIKRNWRTNIVGDLLTQTESFQIVINDEFGKPDITPTYVSSWDEFTAAHDAGSTYIVLLENITNAESYDLTKDVTVDLNGNSLTIENPTAMLNIGYSNNTTKPNVTIKNGQLNCKVYGLSGNVTLSDIKFGGTIAWTKNAQGVISTKHVNLLVERCDMSDVKASAADARPRAFCSEGRSSGYLKLIDCNFPSASDGTGTFVKSKLLRTYINPLSGSAELEIANCKFGVACNIELAASYAWSNMNLTGCTGGFTFNISRSSTSLTEDEIEIYKGIKQNNTGSMRFIFSDGEKNNL